MNFSCVLRYNTEELLSKLNHKFFLKRDENFEAFFRKVVFILVNKSTNDCYFIFCEDKAYENKEIGLYEMSNIQRDE